ncbi:MAG: glycosyltransferase family protein [Rhodospirillaceae bacterium]
MTSSHRRGRRPDRRVLIYSHDSFGLGHLRRCRRIAHALVADRKDLSVLIISGSPIIGSFDFRTRVDFVRVPGVIKLRNGDYTSLSLHMDVEQTLELRESIIRHTTEAFDPDLFLVDKEPLGLRGEVENTLTMLRTMGTPCVLGLRDVMDDPALLTTEWERKNAIPAMESLYDQIWVYGLPQVYDPFHGLTIPNTVRNKTRYTGYLRSLVSEAAEALIEPPFDGAPYLLVTAGGGGDGEEMIDWVLRAYESAKAPDIPALVVFGPFMSNETKDALQSRIDKLERVEATAFVSRLENLMAHAVGVVGMGGYNTFCEILSLDKPSIIVPRKVPRLEQYLRASKAEALGLVRMLDPDLAGDAGLMAEALSELPRACAPSVAEIPSLMDGLESVSGLVNGFLHRPYDATLMGASGTG